MLEQSLAPAIVCDMPHARRTGSAPEPPHAIPRAQRREPRRRGGTAQCMIREHSTRTQKDRIGHHAMVARASASAPARADRSKIQTPSTNARTLRVQGSTISPSRGLRQRPSPQLLAGRAAPLGTCTRGAMFAQCRGPCSEVAVGSSRRRDRPHACTEVISPFVSA